MKRKIDPYKRPGPRGALCSCLDCIRKWREIAREIKR